jgi:hypothetical protein
VREKERASNKALLPATEMVPLYGERPPALLLPIARDSANGEDAALLTVPLIRRRSAASVEASEVSRVGSGDFANPVDGVPR